MIRHMEPMAIWTEDSIEARRKQESQAQSDILTGFLARIAIACLVLGVLSWRG